MNTTTCDHDTQPQYTEIKTDDTGTVIDSRTICECGEVVQDWSN